MLQQTYNFTFIISAILLLHLALVISIRAIANKKYDKSLRIETCGVRNWSSSYLHNRTESTPYLALNSLSRQHRINRKAHLVDFGCGKGRVAIFMYERYGISVTGIELDKLAYKEASDNIATYSEGKDVEIQIENCLAEEYQIKEKENVFFFFNPFHVSTFEKVIHNIIESANNEKKSVEVILYYPIKSYRNVLKNTQFKLIQTINAQGSIGFTERFLVYTYVPK